MSLHSSLSLARLRIRKLVRALRSPEYRAALRRGVLATTDHDDAALGPDFRTVIDVGASRGQFATFARGRWPGARIVCFEPLAESAARISEVVRAPVEVHRCAVGAVPATLTLNVAGRDDASSLLPIEQQATEFPGTAAVGSREVPVVTLDGHLGPDVARPVLLKIDVQGYELEVLQGAGTGIERVDEILCECSFVELYRGQALVGSIVAHLHAHGFALVNVNVAETAADGRQLQADLTFRRSPVP